MGFKRTDDNQASVVAELRKAGLSVRSTASVGKGFPDLVIGYQASLADLERRYGSHVPMNHLIELKDGSKPPSRRALTPQEQEFFDTWPGQVDICISLAEVLAVLSTPRR